MGRAVSRTASWGGTAARNTMPVEMSVISVGAVILVLLLSMVLIRISGKRHKSTQGNHRGSAPSGNYLFAVLSITFVHAGCFIGFSANIQHMDNYVYHLEWLLITPIIKPSVFLFLSFLTRPHRGWLWTTAASVSVSSMLLVSFPPRSS